MSHEAKRNSVLMILIMFCTITIIWTNYIFTKNVVTKVNNTLLENEYEKLWWKDNYTILQELQKREMLWYLESLKKEQPDLIKEILELEKDNKYKILNQNIINDLKKDSYISWSSWATITMIEFSDLECPFCITQHNEWIQKQILENYSDKVNYMFKNFPLPSHKNAQIEAEAAKCVEKVAWWEKYIEYIDLIYNNTKWGWEWFKVEDLAPFAEKISVNKEELETCLSESATKDLVTKEFKQWIMLEIDSTPSNLIFNNKTWEYIIITETIDYKKLEEIILDLSK